MRVNRSIEDGSFFEIPELVSAFERGNRVHLLGLVSHGGVHSHIDHLKALLRFAPEKTWIHAFTDGRDVSPTSAAARSRGAAARTGSRPSSAATTRWTATSAGSARSARTTRSCEHAGDGRDRRRSPRCRRATTPASPTSSSSRSSSTARRGIEPGDTVIFFNFRPDRGRQLTRLLLDGGFDVTTMTRYASRSRDADRLRGAGRAEHARRGARRARRAAAPRRRDREVRPRHVLLQRRPRGGVARRGRGCSCRARATSPSYDFKPADVGRRGRRPRRRARWATASRSASSTSRTPTWSATPASIPAVVEAVETADRCLGRVVERVTELGGVCLVTADHGNAEKMLEADGVSPHTAHTTNPVPLVVTASGARLRDGGELADLAPTVLRFAGDRAAARDDRSDACKSATSGGLESAG